VAIEGEHWRGRVDLGEHGLERNRTEGSFDRTSDLEGKTRVYKVRRGKAKILKKKPLPHFSYILNPFIKLN